MWKVELSWGLLVLLFIMLFSVIVNSLLLEGLFFLL